MTDHPEYGTCTGCTQGVRLDKNGRTRKHSRKVARGGYMQMTVECSGSYKPYAEAGRMEWDASFGKFVDMPIQVAATLFPFDGGDPVPDFYVEVHCWPSTKAGHVVFADQEMKIHLYPRDESPIGDVTVQLVDVHGAVLKEAVERNDGSINGLVLRWMEALGEAAKSAA